MHDAFLVVFLALFLSYSQDNGDVMLLTNFKVKMYVYLNKMHGLGILSRANKQSRVLKVDFIITLIPKNLVEILSFFSPFQCFVSVQHFRLASY